MQSAYQQASCRTRGQAAHEDVGGANNTQAGSPCRHGRRQEAPGLMEIRHSGEGHGKQPSGGASITVGCGGDRNIPYQDAGLKGSC